MSTVGYPRRVVKVDQQCCLPCRPLGAVAALSGRAFVLARGLHGTEACSLPGVHIFFLLVLSHHDVVIATVLFFFFHLLLTFAWYTSAS